MKKKRAGLRKNSLAHPLARIGKTVLVLLPVAAFAITVYFIYTEAQSAFPLREITFVGNTHLTDEELKDLAGLKEGENIFTLSSGEVYEKMMKSPWIRSVMIRKELPDRLRIVVTEAEPFALVDMKRHVFIVDDRGKLLEELKNSPIPFLPVITGNPFEEKEVFLDAIRLAKAIKKTGLLLEKDHVEIIAHEAEELAVNLDGTLVKVGTGDYEGKLERLMGLEDEIKRRGIPVDYIDLRFANRVVVKTVHEVVR
ncbi:MAG: FtsQ-type POTRA domain-containing protein [Candidatus Sulfobium sp.]